MIEQIRIHYYEGNTYIISDRDEAIIIDPISDWEKLIWKVRKFRVKAIIATHGHSDHISGIAPLAEEYHVPAMIHPAEMSYLTPPPGTPLFFDLKPLNQGDIITVGNTQWQVIHTPGHSPGGISLYCREEKSLVCGDVLFLDAIGRTDIYGSDTGQLMKTIREKICTLPPDTIIYPGHGLTSTLEREMVENPYIKHIMR